MFIAALFIMAKIWKQLKCPLADEQTNKAVVHVHNRRLLGHKKKEISPFATAWVDLEDIMLMEISQPEKDKYHMISIICII